MSKDDTPSSKGSLPYTTYDKDGNPVMDIKGIASGKYATKGTPTPSATTKTLEDLFETIWGAALDATSDDFRKNGVLNERAYLGYKSATKKRALAAINNYTTQRVIEELENFEPFFKGNHNNCPDPKTCIGYMNAQSDFDNEKELRLAELKGGIDAGQ